MLARRIKRSFNNFSEFAVLDDFDDRVLQRAGLAAITFHQLRHTAATILLLKNVNPKVVSETLGHATIAMTLDTYSHFLPSMGDQTVRAMEAALS